MEIGIDVFSLKYEKNCLPNLPSDCGCFQERLPNSPIMQTTTRSLGTNAVKNEGNWKLNVRLAFSLHHDWPSLQKLWTRLIDDVSQSTWKILKKTTMDTIIQEETLFLYRFKFG